MSTNIKKDSPDNWITKLSKSKQNKPYYYNKKTKKSQWNQPDILKTGNNHGLKLKNETILNAKNCLNKDNNNFSQKNTDELLSLNLKSGIYKQAAQDRLKKIQKQLVIKNLTTDNIQNKEIVRIRESRISESRKSLTNNNDKNHNKSNKIEIQKILINHNQPNKYANKVNLASKRLAKFQKNLEIEQKNNGNTEQASSVEINDIEMYDDEVDGKDVNKDDNTKMEWEEIDYKNMFNEINSVRQQNSSESNVTTFSFESQLQTDTLNIKEFKLINLNNDKFINNKLYIIIDTNVFLSNLKFIEKLPTIYFKNLGYPIIIVPYIVLCELDKLKHRSDSRVRELAIHAIKFLYEQFKNNNQNYYGQNIYDTHNMLITIENPDDNILNCCLQIKARTKKVILLTNDINLLNKAFCCTINGYTKNELEIDYNKIELK